jgi:hypothetical protein
MKRNLLVCALLACTAGAAAQQSTQPSRAQTLEGMFRINPRVYLGIQKGPNDKAVHPSTLCGALPSDLGTNLSYRTSAAPRISRTVEKNQVCVSKSELNLIPKPADSKNEADDAATNSEADDAASKRETGGATTESGAHDAARSRWLPFLVLISTGDCITVPGPESPAARKFDPCLPVALYALPAEPSAIGETVGGGATGDGTVSGGASPGTPGPSPNARQDGDDLAAPAPAQGTQSDSAKDSGTPTQPTATPTLSVVIYWDEQGRIHYSDSWAQGSGVSATLLLNGQKIAADQASTLERPDSFIPGFPQIPGEPAPPCSLVDIIAVPCQSESGKIHVPNDANLEIYTTDTLACQMPIHVEIYRDPDGCRVYVPGEIPAQFDISFPHPAWCSPKNSSLDNGITIGSPKIFDTFALRKLLATTASQLAGIVPFSQTAITNSFGTLQGVTRDVSYLEAQVTTVPTPSIASTLTTPSTTTQTTTPAQSGNTTTVTATCPPGYVPAIGSGNAVTCTAAISSNVGNSTTLTTQSPTGVSSIQNSGTQGSQVQTSTPSVTGTVAPAPASTALAAPTATAVGSADMLAEQMQLSSQLTMLQMLLQGANSDQLLVAQGRAIGMRAQTTLAFPITLRPPLAYKHAVAEVRVLLIPRRSGNYANAKLSIVNLLPSEKTYNVAKITSKQRQFGAGVAVEAVNVGVSGGKARDRLYIAKDTDTVALQYPADKLDGVLAPWPAWLKPWLTNRLLGKNGSVDTEDCTSILPPEVLSNAGGLNTSRYDFNAASMFGWQFRPVLGADYVASNLRTVFAQLALPEDEDSDTTPEMDVFVQTRWRGYSESKQITASSYTVSCQWKQIDDGVTIYNPIKVKDVTVDDIGGGILRVRAEGDLLSNNLTVRSGATMIPPQFFDGKRIEFFANAIDILHNEDLELMKEDGAESALVIPWKSRNDCKLNTAKLLAVPRPDGTAVVKASFTRGKDYKATDGPQDYKILIGSNVYGLQETPFLGKPLCPKPADDGPLTCSYLFTAQTSALRSAQTFLARDIAWDEYGKRGTIKLEPEFDSIKKISGAGSGGSQKCGGIDAKSRVPLSPCWYEVKGAGFTQITAHQLGACVGPCLLVYKDTSSGKYQVLTPPPAFQAQPMPAPPAHGNNLVIVDDTTLRISDSSSDQLSTLHLVWQHSPLAKVVDWQLALKKPDESPITADPSVLHVNDSRAVKFVGSSLIGFQSATFEGVAIPKNPTATAGASDSSGTVAGNSGNSVTLQIPSSVTAKPGYKEILAVVAQPASQTNGAPAARPGATKTKTVALPILVVEK